MWSVRGIGVAVSVSTSTSVAQLLDALLVRDAEAVLLVDHEQAEVAELHVLLQQAVRADHDVDLAVGEPLERRACAARPAIWKRESISIAHREASRAARGTSRSAAARRTVVGTSTATCLPSSTALNAARSATSVLP